MVNHVNTNQKKSDIVNISFSQSRLQNQKGNQGQRESLTINVSHHQKYIIILNLYATNNGVSKHVRQN